MMTILFWLSLQLNNDFVRYVWSSARTIISFELVWFAYIWKKVMIFLTVCYIRPDFEDLKRQLVGLGANYVVTEEELKSSEMKKTMKVSCVFSTWLSMATKIVTAWSTVLAREAKPFSHIHCINRSALSNILSQARIIDVSVFLTLQLFSESCDFKNQQ